ncbi:MAG: hypothetical protein JST19_06745 [Bacteroidetes bacterium]|nr:hypothetical protein [Bacteroidota bacterium]
MKFKIIGILGIVLFLTSETRAQAILNGTVCDKDTRTALPNVLVRIRHKKQLAISGKSGIFHIPASVNDLLIFTAQGYKPDTLYLVDLSHKTIEMIAAANTLGEVRITASASRASFDPQKEYPEVYEKSKFALSPSRLLGRDARNARRLKHYFDNELRQRKIDSIFNADLVGSIVPLKGRDLRNFMVMYRPRLSFLDKSSPDDLYQYIKNCYSKFITLTPDEQVPARLY